MKTKEKLQKKLNLDDFLSKNFVETIDLVTQSKITGGYLWEGRRDTWNFEDRRISEVYWAHYKLHQY